jgi:hypothetical protein
VLEFCLVWRECPTEEVPILYDECGCDDSQCAPNRILEAYALEVRVDPPPPPAHSAARHFHWGPSIGIAQAEAVVLDETGQRVFVVAGSGAQTIYQVDTQHLLVEASYAAAGGVLSLALAPGGATLYAALAAVGAPQVVVFSPTASGLGAPATPTALEPGSGTIALTAAKAGLFAVDTGSGAYWWFAAPVTLSGSATPATPTGTVPTKTTAAAFSSDGSTVWLGVPGKPSLHSITLATPGSSITVPLTATNPAVGSADAVTVIGGGTGADKLAILDTSGPYLHLYDTGAAKVIASVALKNKPLSLVVTADGGTAVVASAGAVQAVNLVALAAGAANAAGAPFALEARIGQSAITASGGKLYVPFSGTGAAPNQGGVAVVTLSGTDCRDALRGHPCPECDAPDCLVLARVDGWQNGSKLEDMPDPALPVPAGVAYIDNGARTVLASTQAITRALLCLMDQPTAGSTAPTTPTSPPAVTLTHISAISWTHAGIVQIDFSSDPNPSFALAFDGAVNSADLTQPSALMMLVSLYEVLPLETAGAFTPLVRWCQIQASSLNFASVGPPGAIPSTSWNPLAAQPTCTAVQIVPDSTALRAAMIAAIKVPMHFYVRVILNGDLVRDASGNGLDVNHLPPWLGSSPGYRTGDGIAGGVFESWFRIPFRFEPDTDV